MRRRHDAPIRANMENQNHNHYFQPENETMPAEQIKTLQSERLGGAGAACLQITWSITASKMDEAGVKPRRTSTGSRICTSCRF